MNVAQIALMALVIIITIFGTFSYRKWHDNNKGKIAKQIDSDIQDLSLYSWAKQPAKLIKTALQMFLGLGLVALVIIKLFCAMDSCRSIPGINEVVNNYQLSSLSVLEIVGTALAYASAIELAYTLFTPGPDEVVDPLLMGLSAAILLGIAQIDDLTLSKAGATVLYVLVLAGLFLINEIFIKKNSYENLFKRQPNLNDAPLKGETDPQK